METHDELLWKEGLAIVRTLVDRGHQAYLVGGCVRDRYLGRSLHDIDIATSAKPAEVMAAFTRTVPTGLKHGTVTVMEYGRSFEITTFRQEFGYSDARRPDEVKFVTDVIEDLARRDFTFNAMAIGLNGELVDPFGGKVDLEERLVSAVGEASERFEEDALRMLRAIRFAAEFDFQISPELWQGMIKQRTRLGHIAMERVSAEWDRMMGGSGPEQACHYLFKSGLLKHVKEPIPYALLEAIESYRFNTLPWEWVVDFSDRGTLGNQLLLLPLIADADLRWALLLSGFGVTEPDCIELCRTLRFSGRRMNRISGIVGLNDWMLAQSYSDPRENWIYGILAYGRSLAEDWLDMTEAGDRAVDEERSWLAELSATSIAELNIRGDELSAALSKAPGPWITIALQQLLEHVALGNISNENDVLRAEFLASRGNYGL